ncbi:MAG: substrate-binding domain-containing protein [Aminivibrio sp.]|jgi:tungstate transport system substrate-binding protein|nr:tungsten ABC transporter substrate-binding protein [Synergistaceae bacterium]
MKLRKLRSILVVSLLVLALAGAASGAEVLKMATTTSTDNTGLLDYLAELLLEQKDIELQWVAVGTGKALEYGRNGDVDVLLVHAPEVEKKFVAEGWGVNRRQVMYNDFIIVGPASDPAKVAGMGAAPAMKKIAADGAPFASRADKSGTHVAELALWANAGIPEPDKEKWYIQTGQGMLETLMIAGEQKGYCLTDRGTFIKYEDSRKDQVDLVITVEGDDSLKNQYSVIAVNPAKWENLRYDLAVKFIDWMVSAETQKAVADFSLLGKQLFFPNAGE